MQALTSPLPDATLHTCFQGVAQESAPTSCLHATLHLLLGSKPLFFWDLMHLFILCTIKTAKYVHQKAEIPRPKN